MEDTKIPVWKDRENPNPLITPGEPKAEPPDEPVVAPED